MSGINFVVSNIFLKKIFMQILLVAKKLCTDLSLSELNFFLNWILCE